LIADLISHEGAKKGGGDWRGQGRPARPEFVSMVLTWGGMGGKKGVVRRFVMRRLVFGGSDMKSPKCASEMEKVVYEKIEVDRCIDCKGIFAKART